MNMFQMMNAMQNPQGYISQQVMQQAMQQMVNENPAAWKATLDKYGNMDKNKVIAEIKEEYAKQGQNLEQVAAQLGIQL